jgi:uncharacterized protein with GYD domain
MPTYVTLFKFTEQGIRGVKDTVKRTEAAKQAAAQAGITVKDVYWVQGQYDLVSVTEAPDEATAMAFALNIGKAGNSTTQTMRGLHRRRNGGDSGQGRLGRRTPGSASSLPRASPSS